MLATLFDLTTLFTAVFTFSFSPNEITFANEVASAFEVMMNEQAILAYFSMTLTIFIALFLDKVFGEAKKYHYLVGFGYIAQAVEQLLNRQGDTGENQTDNKGNKELVFSRKSALLGAMAWFLLVLPLPILYYLYLNDFPWYWQVLLDSTILYLALGLTSLD